MKSLDKEIEGKLRESIHIKYVGKKFYKKLYKLIASKLK